MLPPCAGTPGHSATPRPATAPRRRHRDGGHHHRRRGPGPHPVVRGQQLRTGQPRGAARRLRLHPAVRPRTGRHVQRRRHRPRVTSSTTPGTRSSTTCRLPSYLVPSTASWDLTSITANAGASTRRPTARRPRPSAGPTTSISSYCSADPGGLPGYPTRHRAVPTHQRDRHRRRRRGRQRQLGRSGQHTGRPSLHYNVSPAAVRHAAPARPSPARQRRRPVSGG